MQMISTDHFQIGYKALFSCNNNRKSSIESLLPSLSLHKESKCTRIGCVLDISQIKLSLADNELDRTHFKPI